MQFQYIKQVYFKNPRFVYRLFKTTTKDKIGKWVTRWAFRYEIRLDKINFKKGIRKYKKLLSHG